MLLVLEKIVSLALRSSIVRYVAGGSVIELTGAERSLDKVFWNSSARLRFLLAVSYMGGSDTGGVTDVMLPIGDPGFPKTTLTGLQG